MKLYLFALLFALGVALLGATFSHHGLNDLLRFHAQIKKTQNEVDLIEWENREMRMKLDLIEQNSKFLHERQLRESLGLVKPDELVYVEADTRIQPTVSTQKRPLRVAPAASKSAGAKSKKPSVAHKSHKN